MTTVLKLRE